MNAVSRKFQPSNISSRMLTSDIFQTLYTRVMTTVEETANYLEVQGKIHRLALVGADHSRYASLSMALSTQLMNVASLALMLRSVRDGDMTLDHARADIGKLESQLNKSVPTEGLDRMAPEFQALVSAAEGLRVRLLQLFTNLARPADANVSSDNVVHRHMKALSAAFS